MLKFFRRIRRKIVDEDEQSEVLPGQNQSSGLVESTSMRAGKFKRYLIYAIGEILLVMIGILLALQVNNWNEWRKDRKIEKSVLLELKNNLERNIALIDIASAEIIEINQTTRTIKQVIEEKSLYPDSLIYKFEELDRSASYLLKLNTNAYESLKNIGFAILSSEVLKNEVLTLFEISYPVYVKETEIINAIWESDPKWWHDYFYIRPSEPGLVPLDYSSLIEDKKFMTIVRDLEIGRKSILNQMKLCKTETQRVLQLIKEELE